MRARRRGEGRLMPGGDGLLPFEARDAAIADIRPLQKYPQEQTPCGHSICCQKPGSSGAADFTVTVTVSASAAVLGRTVLPGVMLNPTTVPGAPPVSGSVS